eukprot:gene4174-4586_t
MKRKSLFIAFSFLQGKVIEVSTDVLSSTGRFTGDSDSDSDNSVVTAVSTGYSNNGSDRGSVSVPVVSTGGSDSDSSSGTTGSSSDIGSGRLYHIVSNFDALPSDMINSPSTQLFNNNKSNVWHPSMLSLIRPSTIQKVDGVVEGDDANQLHPVFQSAATHSDQADLLAIQALSRDRDFNFGHLPKCLLSTGKFIDCLVNSGVSRYLEFKAVDGIYFHTSSEKGKEGILWKIPCSKNDIFNSKQMTALEKRCLMKFHQMVADWGRSEQGCDVNVLNETELAVGRSLYRPQNKAHGCQENALQKNDSKPFDQLMAEYKLSPLLQALIQYGLCFYSGSGSGVNSPSYLTGRALKDLSLHINSLGRYSETALLTTLYGVSEVVQGFCRMAAVWGGIYMLRCSLSSLEGTDDGRWQVKDKEGNTFTASKVVMNGNYLASNRYSDRVNLMITFICWGRILPLERSLAILPPNLTYSDPKTKEVISLGNDFAIRIVQNDYSTGGAPEGMSVLSVQTLLHDSDLDVSKASLATWGEQTARVQNRAAELTERLRVLLFGNYDAVLVKMLSLLTPVTEPRFIPHPSGDSESLGVTGSIANLSLHFEDEMDQAEFYIQRLLGLDKSFEEPSVEGERTYGGDEEDDEMHMLSQALELASKPDASKSTV